MFVLEVLRSVKGRPRAGVACALIVLISVVIALALPGLTQAAANRVLADLDSLGSDAWIVQSSRPASGEGLAFTPGATARLAALPGVFAVAYEVDSDELARTTPDAKDVLPINLVGVEAIGELNLLNAEQTHQFAASIPTGLVGPDAAATLGIDEYPSVVYFGGVPVVITGTTGTDPLLPSLTSSVLVPVDQLYRYGVTRGTETIVVRSTTSQTSNAIRTAVDPLGVGGVVVDRPDGLVAAQARSSGTLATLQAIAAATAIVLGLVASSLILSNEVRRRTAEFAIRRVHGATVGHVMALVVAEALILCALGAAGGLATSRGVVQVVANVQGWLPTWSVHREAIVVASASLAGMLSAVPPAVIAARIQPARAFAVE